MRKTSEVEKWLSSLEDAAKAKGMQEWDKRCEIIKKKFLYEGSSTVRTRKYQIFWSNIQQLQSAIYAKPPKAVVNRRYRDPDPVGRIATDILERAVNFSLDTGDYDTTFKRVRDDFLLYGRGVARVYYEPTYETVNSEEEDITDAEDIAGNSGRDRFRSGQMGRSSSVSTGGDNYPDADGATVTAPSEPVVDTEELEFENVRIRFIHRDDFRHDPARTWEEVTWVAFRAFMTHDELAERFTEEIADGLIKANDREGNEPGSGAESYSTGEDANEGKKASVWEVWDKAGDRVLWVARGHSDVLEEGPPYLALDGFFPCPCPAFGTLTNESLIPVPDFVFYQDQVEEIDQLTARIGALSDSLKLVGFYPAGPQGEGAPEIERAFAPGFENKMIAVQSWAAFKDGGGGGVPVIFLPIESVGKLVEGCISLRKQLVEDVYQIMGLSDIMRGATDAQETAQAQQLKAQFGGVRLRDRQAEIARFCRDATRLVGQIIAAHCEPMTVEKMTNIKLPTAQDAIMADQQYKAQMAGMIQQYQQNVQMQRLQGPQPGQGPQQQPQGPMPGPQGQLPGSPQQPSGPPQGAGIPGSQQPGQQPQQPNVPNPPQPPQPPSLGPTEEDVFALLRDNVQRLFRIDIEAESTVTGDESKEKQDRTSLIEACTKFMEAWGPMVQQNPLLAPLAGALLKFGTRIFRVGRELEEIIEETVEKIEKLAQQNTGAAKPDPKAQAEQIKLQGTQIKVQGEIQKAQIGAQAAQAAAVLKMREIQLQAMAEEHKAVVKAGETQQQHTSKVVQMHHQAGLDALGRAHEAQIGAQQRTHQAGIQQQQSDQAAQQQAAQTAQEQAAPPQGTGQ